MNPLSLEQFTEVQRTGAEAMIGIANKAFEGFEKLVELNLQTMREAHAATQEGMQRAFSAKDPQELFAVQMALLELVSGSALAYRLHVYSVAATTRTEINKIGLNHFEFSMDGVQNFIKNAVASVPTGSMDPMASCLSTIEASKAWHESVQSRVKQAVKVAEGGLNAAADTASKTMQHSTGQPAKAVKN